MARPGAAEQVELGRRAAGELRGEPQPHALHEAGGLAVNRPTVDIDILALQVPHLLHDEWHPGSELAGGIDVPYVDSGRLLVLGRNDRKRRISTVQGSVKKLAQSLLCQRQERNVPFAYRRVDVESVAMCDSPKAIRIVRSNALDDFRACQRWNRLSSPIHKRRNLLARDIEDDETARKRENRGIIEPATRSLRIVISKLAGTGNPNVMCRHREPLLRLRLILVSI